MHETVDLSVPLDSFKNHLRSNNIIFRETETVVERVLYVTAGGKVHYAIDIEVP